MVNIFHFFILFFLIYYVKSDSTLKFVQIWFRHGERLPTHYLTFPGLPDVDYDNFAYPGELTNRGINEEYILGKNIRKYYGDHFGTLYRPKQTVILVGVDNRTSASAQAFFAGFFPPNKVQTWNPDLDWQPIAQRTEETIDWVSTGINDYCNVYRKTFSESAEYKEIIRKVEQMDPELVELLRNRTGDPLDTALSLNHALDSLKIRAILNDSRVPLPTWAKGYDKRIRRGSYVIHDSVLTAQTPTVLDFHNELVLSFFEDHILNTNNTKGVFLAGHDTNLMAIWKSLSLEGHPNDIPEFGAHLSAELHDFNKTYIVKFWFSNRFDADRVQLKTPLCGEPCTLDALRNLTDGHRISKATWVSQCKGLGDITGPTSTITGSMIILLGALILSTIILGCTTFSYRRQLHNIRDPERTRLLE